MRATPRQSPALLAPAVLALLLGACTPSLRLEKRPPPCVDGWSPCMSTGYCVEAAQLAHDVCPVGLDVTQGGKLTIDVPGATAETLINVRTSSEDFTLSTEADGGHVSVDLFA